ncbi:MAG: 3-dehydroquinate synthase, partial [Pseudomonadota bacterium]
WLHGEAVACGMCLAAKMSHLAGFISEDDMTRSYDLISNAELPTKLPAELTPELLIGHMQVDKKNRDGKIRLILLKELGDAFITDDYDPALLHSVLL